MTWNPHQYLVFNELRLRPIQELIARIPSITPTYIIDLGCGTGTGTRLLHERWSDATIVGVDNSPQMLQHAQQSLPSLQWIQADVNIWRTQRPCDLLFSNATLHWLPNHADLFRQLLQMLMPGGVLAVQMPYNFSAPSHTLMLKAINSMPWQNKLRSILPLQPVKEPLFYYDLLAPWTTQLDIWETQYFHVLEGDNPVAEWTKGTWLKPLLDALEEPERQAFEQTYRNLVAQAYPLRNNGVTVFPFRRLFIVARV